MKPAADAERPKEDGFAVHTRRLSMKRAEGTFRRALLAVARGPRAADRRRVVLWRRHDDEILVRPLRATLATGDRLVVVTIPVFTDQTGETEITVAFVTSAPDDAIGFIAATESVPRGPRAIADRFGPELVACAWAALVQTAAEWAAEGEPTVPAPRPRGLAATSEGLVVLAGNSDAADVPGMGRE